MQNNTTQPISGPTPRLYERAFTILASEIRQGTLRPGARLNETGIAARFGISRPPARQALSQLREAGLIQKAQGRGFLVSGDANEYSALEDDDAEEPAEPQRLVSAASWVRIYDEVEAAIIARIAFSSWRIVEAKLALSYSVSRTVARDVVARLQQAGLVRKDDRSRWIAPALTPDHVGELYEMRWVLEPVALKAAAPNIDPARLAQMRVNLDTAIRHARDLRGDDLDRLEHEMHVELLRGCGNSTMMQTIRAQQSLLIAHRFLYPKTLAMFDVEPFLPEHLDIVKDLQAERVDRAAEGLAEHLKTSRERTLHRIERIADAFDPEPLPYLERWQD